MFFPHCAPFFFSCHCPLLLSVLSSVTMTKSKTKSSLLRSTQGDFWLQTNRHTYASRTPMVQSRSCSLVQHGSISSTPTSTPSRTKVAFADFSSATRVSSKHKNRTMQKKKRFSCSITSSSLFWWSQRRLLWQFQGKPLAYRTSGKV